MLEQPDPSQRFLHVLPTLLLKPEEVQRLGRKRASLTLTSQGLGQAVTPAGGVQVRKAFPNRRYLVGGSQDTRRGWLVALPEGMTRTDLVALWEVPLGGQAHRLRHVFELRFGAAVAGMATVYSMLETLWMLAPGGRAKLGALAPLSLSPYASLDGDDLQPARLTWRAEDDAATVPTVREVLELPGVPLTAFTELQGLG